MCVVVHHTCMLVCLYEMMWQKVERIEKFSECLLKMQSLHVGRHQNVLS